MRMVALDYGSKRIGIALSDATGMIAMPQTYVLAEPKEAILDRMRSLLEQEDPLECILVGMPRNMDGSYGPAAEKVKAFVAFLEEQLPIPVKTWDERLTTAQANRVLLEADVRRERRKEKVDSMSAAILLQSYLDSRL